MTESRRCFPRKVAVHWLAATDSKPVPLKAPPYSGSMYFNYIEWHSIIFLAVVDAQNNFLWYKLGANGRQNDLVIFGASCIASALQIIPDFAAPAPITEHNNIEVLYMLIGDDAWKQLWLSHTLRDYPRIGCFQLSTESTSQTGRT